MFGMKRNKPETTNLTESMLLAMVLTQRILEIYYGFTVVFKGSLEIQGEKIKTRKSEIAHYDIRNMYLFGQVALPDTSDEFTPTHFSIGIKLIRDTENVWHCQDVEKLLLHTPNPNQKMDSIVEISCSVSMKESEEIHVAEYFNTRKRLDYTVKIGHNLHDRHIESVYTKK